MGGGGGIGRKEKDSIGGPGGTCTEAHCVGVLTEGLEDAMRKRMQGVTDGYLKRLLTDNAVKEVPKHCKRHPASHPGHGTVSERHSFLPRARRANPFLCSLCRSYASACPASNPIQSIKVVFAKLALSPVPLFVGGLIVAQASN